MVVRMSGELTLNVPDIGDADQIELIEWKFGHGDSFKEGDELCDLVTDKAAFSLEAPSNGVLIEQLAGKGSQLKVGQPLAKVKLASS